MASTNPTFKPYPFAYFRLNMDWTSDACHADPKNRVIRVAHLVAQYVVFPFLLLAAAEALVKNGFFLIANLGIAVVNHIYSLIRPLPPSNL